MRRCEMTTYLVQNTTTYAQDIGNFIVAAPGYLGGRLVVLLDNLAKVSKSPEALKQTVRGIIDVIQAMALAGWIFVSEKTIKLATLIQDTISAWAVAKS